MLPFFGKEKKKDHANDKKRKSSVLGTSQKGELSGSTGADEKRKMATGGTNPPASGSPSILAPPTLVVPEVKTPSSVELDKIIQEVGLDKNPENATDERSFAAKARKSKKSYPYALYILAGSEDHKNLTKPHYLAWEEFIFSTRIKLSVQENSMLKIDFTLFRGNYGLVACSDKNTAEWMQNQTKAFKFEDKNTRAWA